MKRHPITRVGALVLAALAALGCTRRIQPLVQPGTSAVALTAGPGTSMIFVARTDSGVLAIDLGWWGGERALARALRDVDATPSEVRDVFLTHSHRDHVGAWRTVRGSRFRVAASEEPRLVGKELHGGWAPRLAERVLPSRLPKAGELRVRPFSRDTAFALGRDTLRAYLVPGHTSGSAVYLFRGVLFLGDAVTWTPWGGFGAARGIYSDDVATSRRNLLRLLERLPPGEVRYACTAHAHCGAWGPDFLEAIRRGPGEAHVERRVQ